MHPRIATSALICLLLTSCSLTTSTSSNPFGIVVITAGGTAVDDGATDVPDTLDLKVSVGRPLAKDEVGAILDGKALGVRIAGNSAMASTTPMPLSSHHELTVRLGGDEHNIAFQVIGLTGVAAAEHLDPTGGVVADIVFQHAPDQAAVATHAPGGSWRNATHLRMAWPEAALPGQLTFPADLPVEGGSHLVSDFSMALQPVPSPGTLRRVTTGAVSVAPQPVLAFAVSTAASRASAHANRSQIVQLAPTGWRLEPSGLSGAPDAGLVSEGTANGNQLWPLIQNDATQADSLSQALAGSSTRSRLAQEVNTAMVAGGYPGVNLDIEALDGAHRDDYTQFVAELAGLLHGHGMKLAVDVVGHRPGHLTEFAAMFDSTKLRALADATVLMAYDEHTRSYGPGPVAGLDWDEELVRGTFGNGPLSNVWLGLPLYARAWSDSGTSSTSYADAVSTALRQAGAVVDYDFNAATPFIKVNSSLTFFDDADSLGRKAALASSLHMAGLAVWRLGFEDPGFWRLAATV